MHSLEICLSMVNYSLVKPLSILSFLLEQESEENDY